MCLSDKSLIKCLSDKSLIKCLSDRSFSSLQVRPLCFTLKQKPKTFFYSITKIIFSQKIYHILLENAKALKGL